jgi:putative transposase
MSSRNILRYDVPDAYYHVYARGVNKSNIFESAEDKDYLLYLLSRHLSIKPVITKRAGYKYPHYRGRLELLSYCVMDNHFHFLFYQMEQKLISSFMQGVMIAYTRYYNQKHSRTGPLFESRFKASHVNKDSYLLHVSRYIHLNPRSWKRYAHSSFYHIVKGTEPEWLQSQKVLQLHKSRKTYSQFVSDYEENKRVLAELKYQLADR